MEDTGYNSYALRSYLINIQQRTFQPTESLGEFIPDNNFYCVRDSAAENKLGLLITFTQALFIIIKVRPDIVISTGAAPGLAFVFWGRIFGAKTIWLDSVANAEEMSRSGRIAKRYSSLWLSQWPDVAEVHGASYLGRVI